MEHQQGNIIETVFYSGHGVSSVWCMNWIYPNNLNNLKENQTLQLQITH